MNYKYYLYGLNVESEFEIEEAYKKDFDGEPDVRIVAGQMPEAVREMYKDKGQDEQYVATSANAMAFRIPNVGDYWITGDVITINLFESASALERSCFLLGSAFGYCMALRNKLLLHGGAVSGHGKGVIVSGVSGAGKSTTTAALLDKGYLFIADDTCAISTESEKAHIMLGYPQQKLCKDAAIRKGYDLDKLIYINEDRDKYARRLTDGFLPEGADFDYMFEIVFSDDENIHFEEMNGYDKLQLLMRNIYRGEGSFKTWGVPPAYMKECVKSAATTKAYQIARPKDGDSLAEIVDFIDRTVSG